LKNGIPSHDTFRRVFMLIDPKQFEPCFCQWIGQWLGSTDQPSCVAIDGKTWRHSFDRKREQSPLHLVSAWAGERRMVLGQVAVDSTSNEITAIPELLAGLALCSSLVTMDAAGYQKRIAQAMVEQHAGDVLALKGHQQRAFQAVEMWFEEQAFSVPALLKPGFDACDESHGRLTRRRVFVGAAPTELHVLGEWLGLPSIIAVECIRQVQSEGAVSTAKRYFISSTSADDSRLASAIRQH
jgi:predicted transposase YbfD/YdcC